MGGTWGRHVFCALVACELRSASGYVGFPTVANGSGTLNVFMSCTYISRGAHPARVCVEVHAPISPLAVEARPSHMGNCHHRSSDRVFRSHLLGQSPGDCFQVVGILPVL